MDLELSGRVAVITGCSVGIGREVAKVLAEEGVQTVVIARRGALLQTLQDEIVAAGGPRPHAMALDVMDPKTPQAIVEETQACFGRLDILMNNAGGSRPTAVDAPDEGWEESWTLNFTAVHVWAKGLSRVVGRDGITVNCLAPGRIHSEQIDQRIHPTAESQQAFAAQIPLGYFGDPADMAFLVANAIQYPWAVPSVGTAVERRERLWRWRDAGEPSMSDREREDTRALRNRVADDWRMQVGDDGDGNRMLNSDPVLWTLAGDVSGGMVLDAGCATGYVSKKLHDRGALVTGIDFSERMIAIARGLYPEIDLRVDDCAALRSIADEHVDVVIANYVLMDTPDLRGTMAAFHRVLKPGGVAVVVFSHPCFPQEQATVSEDGDEISYRWNVPYFESRTCIDPPWAHFTSAFIWFHRLLSDDWKAFMAAGFVVVDFEEPRVTADRSHLAKTARGLKNSQTRPYSVAFKLQKMYKSL